MNYKTNFLLVFCLMMAMGAHAQSNKSYSGKGKHNGLMRMSQFEGDKGTFYYAYTDATRRGSVMFIDRCGQSHILSESSPDAANEKQLVVNAKVKVMNYAEAEAFSNSLNKIQELGKRNAAVNIIRDQLYKLNELVNNTSYFNCKDSVLLDAKNEVVYDIEYYKNGKEKSKTARVNRTIWSGSLINEDSIAMLYKTAFNNIKEIAIAESRAEDSIYIRKTEFAKAETERLKEKFKQDSTLASLNKKVTELTDSIKTFDAKIKTAEAKTKEANEGKKEAEEAKKLAIAEKELAIKTKDELLDLIKKAKCCKD